MKKLYIALLICVPMTLCASEKPRSSSFNSGELTIEQLRAKANEQRQSTQEDYDDDNDADEVDDDVDSDEPSPWQRAPRVARSRELEGVTTFIKDVAGWYGATYLIGNLMMGKKLTQKQCLMAGLASALYPRVPLAIKFFLDFVI